MNLPGADEMFFRSAGSEETPDTETDRRHEAPEQRDGDEGGPPPPRRGGQKDTSISRAPKPSGRQRHDEKITVYISSPELLALEQTRLTLRAEYGLSADRGRLVREAVAALLADFEENGASSMLVRRLTEE
nr:hypothetical protein [Nocardiopsis kunsanensis]